MADVEKREHKSSNYSINAILGLNDTSSERMSSQEQVEEKDLEEVQGNF